MRHVYGEKSVADFRSRWLRIEFSQSFRGQPVRPLLRFHRAAGPVEEHILPAAVLGRARWIGLAPKDLESLEVVTVSGSAEDIRIDAVRPVSELRMGCTIAVHYPTALPAYLYTLIRGRRAREVLVRSLLDLAPPERFDRFERARARAFEPDGIDAGLRTSNSAEPSVCFVTTGLGVGANDCFRRTLASLANQLDGRFQLVIGVVRVEEERAVRDLLSQLHLSAKTEVRLVEASNGPGEWAGFDFASRSSSEWVAQLQPGDVLTSEAVLVLRDFIAAHPELQVLYADSVASGSNREERRPELKPDWSPAFLDQIDYVGRPCLIRRSLLEQTGDELKVADSHPWRAALNSASRGRTRAEVGHLKRLVLEHDQEAPRRKVVSARYCPPTLRRPAERTSIIIPTRDRVNLLHRAVSSIVRHAGARDDYEILIVDNGSAERETLSYLSSVENGRTIRVLPHPGLFNYPDLMNAGVEAAAGDVIVLLNNDCEARDAGWLDAMTTLATGSDIGAVGAILLYEDGRLQHAGVALGLGGEAGHRDRKLPAEHPGSLGRLTAVHEVSAVTAACLAVERRKYLDVGGLDRAFPVAFNDIDFCLKLQARGYRNLLTPDAVLVHAESASRGPDSGPKRARFEAEAALFRDRWRPMVHDDPFFHPMFSTTRFNDQLG